MVSYVMRNGFRPSTILTPFVLMAVSKPPPKKNKKLQGFARFTELAPQSAPDAEEIQASETHHLSPRR